MAGALIGDEPALVGTPDPEDWDWIRSVLATAARNSKYAKPSASYQTELSPSEEQAFRKWVVANKVPFDPNETLQDYDMRGYWRSLQKGGPAGTAIDPNDGKLHFPDTYKTPYHESFSRQSIYANDTAPVWTADQTRLVDPATFQVIFDDRKARK